MSKAYRTSLIYLLIVVACGACKTSSNKNSGSVPTSLGDGLKSTVADASFEGKWQSRCLLRAKDLYARTLISFSETEVSLSSTYFTDKTCSKAAPAEMLLRAKINQKLVVKGSYKLGEMNAEKVRDIDLKFPNGSAFTVVKIEGQQSSFGKLCKKADLARGACKVEAGHDAEHRSRTFDPVASYTKL